MSASRHNVDASRAFDLVVVAASLGGLRAFQRILAGLRHDFAAPIVYVQHRHPNVDFLGAALRARSIVAVTTPEDGELPAPGAVYLAPADRQLRVTSEGRFASEPSDRCSADALLESAAAARGERTIAVILTGRLEDGAAGARAVKRSGGRVIVQDPSTAAAGAMPRAAIATGCADFVLPIESIAPALRSLVMVPGAAELFAVRLSPWAAMG